MEHVHGFQYLFVCKVLCLFGFDSISLVNHILLYLLKLQLASGLPCVRLRVQFPVQSTYQIDTCYHEARHSALIGLAFWQVRPQT